LSQAQYHAWLLKIATGWLGWTEQQALATRMTTIVAAYDGRMDMLKAIFGSGEKSRKGKPPADGLVSAKDPAAVKALFMGLKAKQDG
jgi:hypothetical protein